MRGSITGVSDHGGWAVLVTVAHDGSLLDRRRVELVDEHLPAIPHHHEAQRLPLDEATALIERVRISSEKHAALALAAVARAVPDVAAIALRSRPPLPPTVAERLEDYRARNLADWVMYREALATAAQARGWSVHWFDPKTVLTAASRALHIDNFDPYFAALRTKQGPPWNADHKLALAAAISAMPVHSSG